MAHVDAAGGQHLLHHAQAQGKAEVEPDRVADDLAWKAVAGIRGLGGGGHAGPLPVSASPAKPRPKLTVPRYVPLQDRHRSWPARPDTAGPEDRSPGWLRGAQPDDPARDAGVAAHRLKTSP